MGLFAPVRWQPRFLLASLLASAPIRAKEERAMLTDTTCRNLKPKAKPYKKSDGAGLYLLVKPSGSKHWYMGYRFGGRQKKLSFGAYPEITLSDAREKLQPES
ncbi:MAG: Arm DNA-binding domain-containing protein [Rhizomicrobium sp.]